MSTVLAWTAFVLGTFLCLTNFYLSVLRYLLHRLRGLPRESYRWVSGIPLFGSLLVALSLLGLYAPPGMLPAAIALIVIDTGGIHWLLGVMIYQSVYGKKQKHG
jgi:hypothetical protein